MADAVLGMVELNLQVSILVNCFTCRYIRSYACAPKRFPLAASYLMRCLKCEALRYAKATEFVTRAKEKLIFVDT